MNYGSTNRSRAILEIVFRILSIRGHIPQFGKYECPPVLRNEAPRAISRVVISVLAGAAVFALTLWLAIRLI
jgi:hypothetical protein